MRKEMKSVGLGQAILVPEPAATVIGPAIGNAIFAAVGLGFATSSPRKPFDAKQLADYGQQILCVDRLPRPDKQLPRIACWTISGGKRALRALRSDRLRAARPRRAPTRPRPEPFAAECLSIAAGAR